MANYNALFPSPDNLHLSLRQADGKALGRVRAIVKGSAPQAGMKDYRFFVTRFHRCQRASRRRRSSGSLVL